VPLFDPVRLAQESVPIERSPMPILEINKKGQDEEDNNAGQNAFSIHEKGEISAPHPNARSRETAPLKVNDSGVRVKLDNSLGDP